MNNFNIGDWVNFKSDNEVFKPFKLEPKHFDFPSYWWRNIEHWEPKEEECTWIEDGDEMLILLLLVMILGVVIVI